MNQEIQPNGELISNVDYILKVMREEIIYGKFKPKEKIPEIAIASRFNVSRSPVRECLRKLESEGLVNIVPRRGAFVSDFSAEDMDRLFSIRILLEGFGAELACQNMTENDLNYLSSMVDEMSEALMKKDYQRYFRTNTTFHEVIYKLTKNDYLYKMLKTLADLSLRYRYFLQNLIVRNKYKAENANHLKLLEAFMARDCKMAKKLRYKALVRGEKVLRRAISQIPSYEHTHRATSKKNPQTGGYYSGSVGYGL